MTKDFCSYPSKSDAEMLGSLTTEISQRNNRKIYMQSVTDCNWTRTSYLSAFSPDAGKCGENADQNNFEYGHFLRSVSIIRFNILQIFSLAFRKCLESLRSIAVSPLTTSVPHHI